MRMTQAMRDWQYELAEVAPVSTYPISKRGDLAGAILSALADAQERMAELETERRENSYDPVGYTEKRIKTETVEIHESLGATLENFIVNGVGKGHISEFMWFDYMHEASCIEGLPRKGDVIWAMFVTDKDNPEYRRSNPSAAPLWEIVDKMPIRRDGEYWFPHSEPRQTA